MFYRKDAKANAAKRHFFAPSRLCGE